MKKHRSFKQRDFAPPLNETIGAQMPEIIGISPEIMNFCRRFLSLKTDSVKSDGKTRMISGRRRLDRDT